MDPRATSRSGRVCSYEGLVAIVLTVVAVFSPLYIHRRADLEDDEESINLVSWLPLWLLVLILAIALSLYCDPSYTRFDMYWIHRVGGSSGGIIIILMVLALVLKCKAET